MGSLFERDATGALARFFRSKPFEFGIVALIGFNAVIMGLETVPAVVGRIGGLLEVLNVLILAVFVVEICLKIYAFGREFWRDGWSWFDLAVILFAVLPTTDAFAALRALRAVRLLRLVTIVPSLRRVVEGLLKAIPGLSSIMVLLALLIYVFAVMATRLFGGTHPELFGSLGASAFSLFAVMTLEGWPDLARDVMKSHPGSWLFFIVFIMITSWAVLNLFIGVIVESMQAHTREREEEIEQEQLRNQVQLAADISAIKRDLAELNARLKSPAP